MQLVRYFFFCIGASLSSGRRAFATCARTRDDYHWFGRLSGSDRFSFQAHLSFAFHAPVPSSYSSFLNTGTVVFSLSNTNDTASWACLLRGDEAAITTPASPTRTCPILNKAKCRLPHSRVVADNRIGLNGQWRSHRFLAGTLHILKMLFYRKIMGILSSYYLRGKIKRLLFFVVGDSCLRWEPNSIHFSY